LGNSRPEFAQVVKLAGQTESFTDHAGNHRVHWVPGRVVIGIPYDTPIVGYRVDSCALLRLWSAEAAQSFDFEDFNRGDYYGAVEEKVSSETISKALYPNDEQLGGKSALGATVRYSTCPANQCRHQFPW
jgi:starch phosphorylase